MSILKTHGRIPGQLFEATSPVSAQHYMELERQLEQEKELDERAKKVLRRLLKAIGGLGALSLTVLGVKTVNDHFKDLKNGLDDLENTAKETAQSFKGVPNESEDLGNIAKGLGVSTTEARRQMDSRYGRSWIGHLLKEKKSMTGKEYTVVRRRDHKKLGLVRNALKKHYGGYVLSYDPGKDLIFLGPKGESIPTPFSRDVYSFIGAAKRAKAHIEHTFSRHPALKNTPVYKDYIEVSKKLDELIRKKDKVGSMNPREVVKYALDIRSVRDKVDKTIKKDEDFMGLLTNVQREMERKGIEREKLLTRWGYRDIPTSVAEVKKQRISPTALKEKMTRLSVLLSRDFKEPEAKQLASNLRKDVESIGKPVFIKRPMDINKKQTIFDTEGKKMIPPKYDTELLPQYVSNLSQAKEFLSGKLPMVIGEAATEVDRSLIESIRTSLPYQGKVVLF